MTERLRLFPPAAHDVPTLLSVSGGGIVCVPPLIEFSQFDYGLWVQTISKPDVSPSVAVAGNEENMRNQSY